MKLVEHFQDFLRDTVDLNATRLDELEKSVVALKDVLRASSWAPILITFQEQGSWAHGTIIRPVDGKPFDADLLVIIKPVKDWDACDYLSKLRAVFAGHGVYSDKVTRSSHCITIEYAKERRVDIVPCIRDRNGIAGNEVCNFGENAFQRSEPEAYTQWLRDRNQWSGRNGLKKTTRLLKYLRDFKTTFSCPSVLLTTLLGMQLSSADATQAMLFADIATALKTIIGRLDAWLQARPTKPMIANPVMATELFSDMWTEAQYNTFRSKIAQYRSWIDEAYDEPDRDESIGLWRRVFGDDFAVGAVQKKAASVSDDARTASAARSLRIDSHDDLVSLIAKYGLSALPPGFDRLPHKARPRWRRTRFGGLKAIVSATMHSSERGPNLGHVASGGGPLPKGRWLRFEAHEAGGALFGSDKYRVHWRITNTDHEATMDMALRGGFETANEQNARWESVRYRGVHTAEAFVVRRNDDTLVAESAPFYVTVE